MAELGCLRDSNLQNLQVEGKTIFNGTLSVGALSKVTNISNTAGTVITNNTDAVTLTSADHGKIFSCLLDGAAKTVNLPANMTAADVGTRSLLCKMRQASGELTILANTGNTFSVNGYYSGMNGGAGLRIAITRPADANNKIVITGADANSAWGWI